MKTKIFAAGLSLAALTPLNAQQKPNVVFIVADDLGYGDLSCYGQEKFQTPNIDRLALNGIRFTRSYSGTTVSAPSRAKPDDRIAHRSHSYSWEQGNRT